MRPAAMALISGGVGFLTGAAAYGWVAAKSLGVWNRVVQTQFAIEQEQRSARAERQGDLLAALHHRWNVVEARSDAWLHSFETWEPPAPWFALGFLMLRKIAEGADPEGKGHRVVEGIARGQLARGLGPSSVHHLAANLLALGRPAAFPHSPGSPRVVAWHLRAVWCSRGGSRCPCVVSARDSASCLHRRIRSGSSARDSVVDHRRVGRTRYRTQGFDRLGSVLVGDPPRWLRGDDRPIRRCDDRRLRDWAGALAEQPGTWVTP